MPGTGPSPFNVLSHFILIVTQRSNLPQINAADKGVKLQSTSSLQITTAPSFLNKLNYLLIGLVPFHSFNCEIPSEKRKKTEDFCLSLVLNLLSSFLDISLIIYDIICYVIYMLFIILMLFSFL